MTAQGWIAATDHHLGMTALYLLVTAAFFAVLTLDTLHYGDSAGLHRNIRPRASRHGRPSY
jgi:hypothetical protein